MGVAIDKTLQKKKSGGGGGGVKISCLNPDIYSPLCCSLEYSRATLLLYKSGFATMSYRVRQKYYQIEQQYRNIEKLINRTKLIEK